MELKEDDVPAAIPNSKVEPVSINCFADASNVPPQAVQLKKLVVPSTTGKVAGDKLAPLSRPAMMQIWRPTLLPIIAALQRRLEMKLSPPLPAPIPVHTKLHAADTSENTCPFKTRESILLKDALANLVLAVCLSLSFQSNGFIKVQRNNGTTMACSPSILHPRPSET